MQRLEHSHLRLERRTKPRVSVPFRATVQGVDRAGEAFETATVVDNLSAGGLYLRIRPEVSQGAGLLVNVDLAGHAEGLDAAGLNLEVYGHVRRVDPLPGGAFGVALAFSTSVFV